MTDSKDTCQVKFIFFADIFLFLCLTAPLSLAPFCGFLYNGRQPAAGIFSVAQPFPVCNRPHLASAWPPAGEQGPDRTQEDPIARKETSYADDPLEGRQAPVRLGQPCQ